MLVKTILSTIGFFIIVLSIIAVIGYIIDNHKNK
jgi:hypothetical protein